MKKNKQRLVDERLSFTLHEDHITAGKGEFYFLRLYPRNMDILSFYERDREYRKLQVLLDSDGSEIAFLSLDKTEGLEEVRGYYESLIQQYPLHKAINGEILQQLDGLASHSCVERAHYLILRVKERSGFERFRQLAEGYLRFRVADRAELLVLLKNFLLREYSALRLADWDEDIQLNFETEQAAYEEQNRHRRRNSPPEYVELAQRETQRLLPR